MSKGMMQALAIGALIAGAGWWWLRKTKPTGQAVYRDGVFWPPSQSPDVIVNPKRPETYYL